MARVEAIVRRQGEQGGDGAVEGVGVAAGEVAAGGADVGLEEGVAGEGVGADEVADVVRGVAGEVQDAGGEGAEGEGLVVVEEVVEGVAGLGGVDAVAVGEAGLDGGDALADADVRARVVLAHELVLQVAGGGQVVGVHVGFEQAPDGVVVFGDEGEEGVGGGGGDFAAGGVEVEDGVDDDRVTGRWVGDDVLPGAGLRLETDVDEGLLFFAHGDVLVGVCVDRDELGLNAEKSVNGPLYS